jgi:hypothetical protein
MNAILRIIIFTVTFLTFARLIPCQFTWWDDNDTISQNSRLNPPTWNTLGFYWTTADEHQTMGLYVPVTYTLWSGLARIAHRDQPDSQGLFLNAWVFHLANIFIHAVTALVVFQLPLRLLANNIAAAFGALLFALHPVQVESVGWISGTKDLLCGLFSVSALLMQMRSVQTRSNDPHKRWPARWRYWIGLLFFILAMLSKPTAVVVPLMCVVITVCLLGQPLRKTIISLIPWFLLMIPCLYLTQKVQPAPWASPLPIWVRPVVAADALAFYFYKLVLPIHLCIDYGHNQKAIVANHEIYFTWILPAVIAMLLLRRCSKHLPVLAAWLLFLLPLAPILGFVPFEFQLISTTADHYLYLPMVGVALFAAWLIQRFCVPNWITIVILTTLGIRCVLQEPYWHDTRSLFNHTLAINPRSVPSLDGMGYITGRDARRLTDAGQIVAGRKLFKESIAWYQKSLAYDPNSTPSMLNLALDYQKIGRTDLGLQQIHHIVQVQPEIPQGLRADPISLAHLLIDFGDTPGAIAWLDDVLGRDPANTLASVLREHAIEHLNESNKK